MPRVKASGAHAAGKKPRAPKTHQLAVKFPNGEVLRDLCKKNWQLGNVIGQGGFGLIYLASDKDCAQVGTDAEYVVKIEPISNGPLFCELHFYQRVAKPDLIDSWLKSRKLKYLGIPRYVASGQHTYKGSNYRFMVMERFSTDLQKIFEDTGKLFTKQTVFALALRLIDALEYLHENDYIHADVKASNCLLGFKKGKPDANSIYLVDFGLASKYISSGVHREYKEDPRKAHDGTVEFTSIDAHKGVGPSRRGDMEILGYCLLQWLCSTLPWEDKLTDKTYVRDSKTKYMNDIPALMKKCFPKGGAPSEMSSYLTMAKNLEYEEKPNYNKMRDIFVKGLSSLAVKDTWKLSLSVGGATKMSSPKKAVKRPICDSNFDEPVSKLKVRAASSHPGTPKSASRRTPKTASRSATPQTADQKKKAIIAVSPAPKKRKVVRKKLAVKSPKAGRTVSPAAGARALGSKAIAGTLSSAGASKTNKTAKRTTTHNAVSPAPKKRKVVRKKHVQMAEMSVQTSPGLKKNK